MRISDRHLAQLRQHGYVIIKNFLTEDEVVRGLEGFYQYYPSVQELQATPQRYGGIYDDPDSLQNEFPFASPALNHHSLHPAILSGVSRFLGVPMHDIRLSQAAIWAKYAGIGNYEQGLHFDYQGNTLVVPRDDADFQQLNFILYYTDVTAKLGPTAVVSKEVTMRGEKAVPLWPAFKTRAKHPELYDAEKYVTVPAGSMLIFTMSTLHRATAMKAQEGCRFSHHLVYRSARHDFQGYHLWSRQGESEDLQQFVQACMPEQRHALGFPHPDSDYWTPETLRAVNLRYPAMDLEAYRAKSGEQVRDTKRK
jgi:ectoine hydroxylase-related dioxygenase (phytanoyl-CoA dioxygenase family)